MNTGPDNELGFDIDELRAKYASERDKRFRPDGVAQYQDITLVDEHYTDVDPYAESDVAREPVTKTVDVLLVGAGFGGLIQASNLENAGVASFLIVDKAGDFGGTWYWNRYPHVQCDIESYIYMPLLEETGYMPTAKYAIGAEIFAHAQRIGRHFNLYERALFHTQATDAYWDTATGRWTVSTDRGDTINAKFMVVCGGLLNRPKLPGIPGVKTFKGHMFHTNRWDYEYTGGDATGGLEKLRDKRVALIGTGCTTVQAAVPLAEDALHLYVVQRTPSAVHARNQKTTDPEWVKSLGPGWRQERLLNFVSIASGQLPDVDMVSDEFSALFGQLSALMHGDPNIAAEDMALIAETGDFQAMNKVRDRVSETVEDPDVADALKPWYGQWCKRPTFSDTYLQIFNRPNVTLVDTDGQGVERITERAVVVGGVEYEVDCIIFATGFDISSSLHRRYNLELHGEDGLTLSEYWSQGMRTFHGTLTHKFPNCFHMGHTQIGLSPNYTYEIETQSEHVTGILTEMLARGVTSVQPTKEAEAAWMEIVSERTGLIEYFENCTPGYFNGEGAQAARGGHIADQYPAGAMAFRQMAAEWRETGEWDGLSIVSGDAK